jgi:hypothetical protein
MMMMMMMMMIRKRIRRNELFNFYIKNQSTANCFFSPFFIRRCATISAYTRLTSGSLLQKHDYKTLRATKEGRPSLHSMFKIHRFVYVLHRIDKRGEANKI